MSLDSWIDNLKNTLGRGIFPHQMSFFLDLRLRNLLLSPQRLASQLSLKATSWVLEVGAGSGFYSAEVARRVPEGQLELLDVQPEMLYKAKQKLEAEGLHNTGYTLADAGKLPFKEDSFDVAFLVTVLGEIADQHSFLGEAHRVLKPKGVLSITEHLPDPDFSPLGKVKTLVEKFGFELHEHYGGYWNYTVNFRKSEALNQVSEQR
jgi:ubiquinone/menaquinone biosynthesis C-methylase UbiE